MMNFFFLFLSFFTTETAMKLSVVGDHEASNLVLNRVKTNKKNIAQYLFLRATNAYALNKKDEALKYINMLEDSFDEIPMRYRNLGYLMELEIQGWSERNLGDIGRDMRISKDRLRVAKGGPKTQKVQKQILDKLDDLIKEKEDQMNSEALAAQVEAKKQNPMPAINEIVPPVTGKGEIDDKKLKVIADSWGTLPEKEKTRIIAGLTRDLPARYRVVIEDYFKALSNGQKP